MQFLREQMMNLGMLRDWLEYRGANFLYDKFQIASLAVTDDHDSK
jgi:hypothetical protein